MWVRLWGELDLAGVPLLAQALRQSAASAPLLVIDLRGVTFMDCTGLQAIIAAEVSARRCGAQLALVTGPVVNRLLELVGLAKRFTRIDQRGSRSEPEVGGMLTGR